jgi:hypothetical protein
MKKALLLAAVMVLSANLAFAQAGAPNIFADPLGTSCDLFEVPPGLWTLYVVHMLTPGATAIQFSAPVPACAIPNLLWLSDTAVYPVTIGNSQAGVAIGYGGCIASPNVVLFINVFMQIPGIQPCCLWPVLPDPAAPSGTIEVVDCLNNLHFVGSQPSGVINPDPSCSCFLPIAVEETTWGSIKSIYSE